jgi:hypothetical protein
MKFGVMLTETLASMEDLLAVWATPCEPLLMELLFVRFPVRLRLESLVTEGAREILWRRC